MTSRHVRVAFALVNSDRPRITSAWRPPPTPARNCAVLPEGLAQAARAAIALAVRATVASTLEVGLAGLSEFADAEPSLVGCYCLVRSCLRRSVFGHLSR